MAGVIRNMKGAKGGAFVQAAEPDRIVQAMQDYIHLGSISLDELTEARIAIQDVIVRLACIRASEADLDELQAIAEKTKLVNDVEARYECAVAYYAVLARATQNRVFAIFVESLSSILHNFVRGPGYETLQETLIQSRLRLVRFLRARDADSAAEEMRKHLERIHRHVRKNIKGVLAVAEPVDLVGRALRLHLVGIDAALRDRPLLPPLLPPDYQPEIRPHYPGGWGSGVGSQASRAITPAVSPRSGRSGPGTSGTCEFLPASRRALQGAAQGA